MNVEELRVGVHVSRKEMEFVSKVVKKVRLSGYSGVIRVVGSRWEGSRISFKRFGSECMSLESDERNKWLGVLNRIAREHDLSAGEIGKIETFLPEDTPREIRYLFESRSGHVDSDLDLAVEGDLDGIDPNHEDDTPPKGSGLVIEIYTPGDYSYLIQSPYNY
jgi:hypothetical protein